MKEHFLTESEARKQILDAGKKLVNAGLVARTWGNISARISDTQMIITPSGRAYETLGESDLVRVNIEDCSYEGTIKPSSEKGIHADVYRQRKEINFIIHTHQTKASTFSVAGVDLSVQEENLSKIIGNLIPCAAYGISATKMLKKAISKCVEHHPDSKGFLMRSHGALCLGRTFEEAFLVSSAMEEACQNAIEKTVLNALQTSDYSETKRRELYANLQNKKPIVLNQILDFGSSTRMGDRIILECNGKKIEYDLNAMNSDLPTVAKIHERIYRNPKIGCILHEKDLDVCTVSASSKALIPALDDLAQIAGTKIRSVTLQNAPKGLGNRNAVLLREGGAFCVGSNFEEASAVAMVLQKGCAAEIYRSITKKKVVLGFLDRLIQRTFYVMKYSKLKKQEESHGVEKTN